MTLIEDIVANLTQEFLGDASDRLSRMQVCLTNLAAKVGSQREALLDLAREVHSVKGSAGNFGFRSVTTVAHRLEDFMAASMDGSELPVEDYQRFVDVMTDLIELGREPEPDRAGRILKSLPVLAAFDPDSVTFGTGRALVVTRARTMSHMLVRELANCGYQAQTAIDPFDAIRLAASEKPDVILTSAVMDGLSGVDLVAALRAIKGTSTIPCAVVTSFDRTHPELAGLPKNVGVVRLGKTLSDDLAIVLTWVGEQRADG